MTYTQLSLFCGLGSTRERPLYFDNLIRLARQNEPDHQAAGLLAIAYAAFASRVRDVTGKSGATTADAIESAYALRHDRLMLSVAQVLNCEAIVHNLISQYAV